MPKHGWRASTPRSPPCSRHSHPAGESGRGVLIGLIWMEDKADALTALRVLGVYAPNPKTTQSQPCRPPVQPRRSARNVQRPSTSARHVPISFWAQGKDTTHCRVPGGAFRWPQSPCSARHQRPGCARCPSAMPASEAPSSAALPPYQGPARRLQGSLGFRSRP